MVITSTAVLFEIILILERHAGALLARRLPAYGASCSGERPADGWPAFEMKTLPENPATSFVLFETAPLNRVGRVPDHVGFETSAPLSVNLNYLFVNTSFLPSFLPVAHSLHNRSRKANCCWLMRLKEEEQHAAQRTDRRPSCAACADRSMAIG